jgi:hypothetical protein
MLVIAGGIILGVIGLLAILWLVGAVIENQEEIAQGCAFIVGLLIIIAIGAWLDSEWPEINWINTALAVVGCLFAALMAFALLHDSPLFRKKTDKEPPKIRKIYFEIGDKVHHDIRSSLRYYEKLNEIIFFKDSKYVKYKDSKRIHFYFFNSQYVVRNEDGSLTKFEFQDEALTYFMKCVLD